MPAAMSGYTDFNPEKDIPSLTGKVVVVTGGTAGIGRATVLALAKRQPAHLYFTGRNTRSAQSVIDGAKESSPGVEITFVKLDMNSLAAVKEACTQFTHDRLDILMCNAGIMQQPPGVSVNGYERHFATNHLAHAMLIQQLLPTMLKTAKLPGSDVRLIMTTSLGWVIHPKGGILFEALKTSQEGLLGSYYTYGYFVYFSQYVQGIGTLTEAQGCLSQLWAAAGARKEQIVNGAYYRPVGVMSNGDLNKTATDLKLAEKLWIWTADVLSKY
ncbi:hypothetical protein TruAng_005939 [Truncatella angustata]|nr:hypothetical protein TruAng_005939 [Truncatella angustata]